MTREDIIRMAQEAYGDWYPNAVPPQLERFAELVADAERERCADFLERGVNLAGLYPDLDWQLWAAKLLVSCAYNIRSWGSE